jgi:hypothetical protein
MGRWKSSGYAAWRNVPEGSFRGRKHSTIVRKPWLTCHGCRRRDGRCAIPGIGSGKGRKGVPICAGERDHARRAWSIRPRRRCGPEGGTKEGCAIFRSVCTPSLRTLPGGAGAPPACRPGGGEAAARHTLSSDVARRRWRTAGLPSARVRIYRGHRAPYTVHRAEAIWGSPLTLPPKCPHLGGRVGGLEGLAPCAPPRPASSSPPFPLLLSGCQKAKKEASSLRTLPGGAPAPAWRPALVHRQAAVRVGSKQQALSCRASRSRKRGNGSFILQYGRLQHTGCRARVGGRSRQMSKMIGKERCRREDNRRKDTGRSYATIQDASAGCGNIPWRGGCQHSVRSGC